MEYYKIDKNGYAVMTNTDLPFYQRGFEYIELGEDEEIPDGYILVPDTTILQLWLPRWDDEKWVEGLTQEEIDELNKPTSQELTTEQRLAQLEVLTVNNLSNQIENQILKGVI